MSTKTYVFEKDGQFVVVCKVECYNQPMQWCDSQEAQIIESVEKEIEAALVTEYYLVINNDTAMFIDDCGTEKPMNDLYGSDIYYSKRAAERFIENELNGNYSVQQISRVAFDRQVAELDAIQKENYIAPAIEENKVAKIEASKEKIVLPVGKKVKHARFGVAVITEEIGVGIDKKFRLVFEDGSEKLLLERFANLTYL
jgi:hypothetical protein